MDKEKESKIRKMICEIRTDLRQEINKAEMRSLRETLVHACHTPFLRIGDLYNTCKTFPAEVPYGGEPDI